MMADTTTPVTDGGATGAVQEEANALVASATKVANQVVDLGEEAAATVLDAVIEANLQLGNALKTLRGKLVGAS
jgi:hypothetical protein